MSLEWGGGRRDDWIPHTLRLERRQGRPLLLGIGRYPGLSFTEWMSVACRLTQVQEQCLHSRATGHLSLDNERLDGQVDRQVPNELSEINARWERVYWGQAVVFGILRF